MAWFKVDDTMHSHEKPKRMPRAIRNEAMGLWTLLGSWAAQHETDGVVPGHIVDDFGGTEEVVDALVEAELWDRNGNGVTFRNWGEYQPLRVEKDDERAKTAERVRRYRERQKEQKAAPTSTDSNGVTGGVVTVAYGRPDPTRPDPTPTTTSDVATAPPRPEIEELCTLLADRIEGNGSKRPTISKGWRDAARKMLDIDGRTPDQITRLIEWSQSDEFWRANIQSMPKLRQKFDQLRLKAQTPARQQRRGVGIQSSMEGLAFFQPQEHQ